MSRRTRRRGFAATAVVLTAAVGGTTVYAQTRPHDAAVLVSHTASAQRSPTTVDKDTELATAVQAAAQGHDGEVSVTVYDETSGSGASYASGDGTYDTASIVKVDVLAALLLRAQDEGRELTVRERTYATAMIEKSDNDATTALWDDIGGADGLDAANERLGLTGTSGGDGSLWGLTQTTAADQLALLKQVFGVGDGLALTKESRSYVQELMGNVESDQAWGVSAAGDGAALKNGWLRRSTTGLWDINSVGEVTAGGRKYLVAVVSNGSVTKDAGVGLVEDVARAAVPVVSGAA
ncbi:MULTISPECIES: serine hydrolase [unclassified Streptomyces]|uniref:serine hydrolase n=1 Tax=unclassified Streptomyces TaxID=2593676 RepID=UPI00278BBAAC|nr:MULTISPECIES: serine hydrolase [unclassified Streptomyces]